MGRKKVSNNYYVYVEQYFTLIKCKSIKGVNVVNTLSFQYLLIDIYAILIKYTSILNTYIYTEFQVKVWMREVFS